jgi:hypothetical protein
MGVTATFSRGINRAIDRIDDGPDDNSSMPECRLNRAG